MKSEAIKLYIYFNTVNWKYRNIYMPTYTYLCIFNSFHNKVIKDSIVQTKKYDTFDTVKQCNKLI